MLDIKFLRKFNPIRNEIVKGDYNNYTNKEIFEIFEKYRNRNPFIFNIETTNICNMTCIMCPRTSLMNRKLETMNMDLFSKIIEQIKLYPEEELKKYHRFVKNEYGIEQNYRNENAFYYYISATHLTLHGYGEPVLDPQISEKVNLCTLKNIPTYFSIVPANIKIPQIENVMKSGLGVLKLALDSLDDQEQKRIRGKNNNFTEAYEKILKLIDIKEKNDYDTKIVITLIDLSAESNSIEIKEEFMNLWKDKSVYPYIKSQDNRWLYEEDSNLENKSHYEKYYCEFAWTSLTVMVDGTVVPCTQDYNTEMGFGNVKDYSLEQIWNNEKYAKFRNSHICRSSDGGWKCAERCDIKKLYQRIT